MGLFGQEYATDTTNSVDVNRLWYSFPVGDFTIVGGPKVRMDDMLPVWPSAYPSDMTYDFFTYAGAPGAYNLAMGGGAGVYYTMGDWSIATSYLSTDANNSEARGSDPGGFMTDGAGSSATTQIAYAPESWGVAVAYTYASGENGVGLAASNATPNAVTASTKGNSNSYGVSAWWTPEESGWIPSISTGFGQSFIDDATANTDIDYESTSWYVGFEWDDAFIDGNSLGFAVGQPTWVSKTTGDDAPADSEDDPGYAFELFYKFAVTDNITVTPALTLLTKPYSNDATYNEVNALSGLVKTTFKF